MAGKSKTEIARLSEQATRINTIFADSGFEQIEPDIIQPADTFLEQIGENVRARTYVFSDLEGDNLCLRPDLTVPAARYYLDHISVQGQEATYRYLGPAFRFQLSDNGETQPREFEQAGIEFFGGKDQAADEAQVLLLAIRAVESADLKNFRVKTGDLEVFSVIIDQLDMPAHWAQRLKSTFWRPDMFKTLLEKLSGQEPDLDLPDFARDLVDMNRGEAVLRVEEELQNLGLPAHGLRNVSEIAERLREKAMDQKLPPLSPDVITLIKDYLTIECPLKDAAERIEQVATKAGIDLLASLDVLETRVSAFEQSGIPMDVCSFCAEYGRKLEYYSGFVFQIEAPNLQGLKAQLAGGGRYDDLLFGLGADTPIPAVGCAIHTERLLTAVTEQGGDNV